jgi:hypothetical protein
VKERLSRFLVETYRRDVLGESIEVDMSDLDLAEVEREIAAIDGLKLGAHLASRDFVSYQNRRALVAVRDKLKAAQAQQAQEVKQLPPPEATNGRGQA